MHTDANNPKLIEAGFDITKDYESTKKAWDDLIAGDIIYSSSERKGQCYQNIVQADLHCFSILHFKLRSLDFAQKILYRLHCGQKDWRNKGLNQYMTRILSNLKKECIDQIRHSTGMLIDSPCGTGGTVGPEVVKLSKYDVS